MAGLLALVMLSGTAAGQDFQRPGTPRPERPQADPPAISPTREAESIPLNPAAPGDPASLLGGEDRLGVAGSLYTEGTILNRRTGLLLRAPTGESVFVFDAPADGSEQFALPAMVVLPSQSRARMEQLSEADSRRRFAVSGELTVYRGRNYLAATSFSRAQDSDGVSAVELEDGDLTRLADDPSVDELIKALEDRRDLPRGLMNPRQEMNETGDRVGGGQGGGRRNFRSQEDQLATAAAINEGLLLSRRSARLMRLPGGELALALDQGLRAEDSAIDAPRQLGDDPIVPLPCGMTERLERMAQLHGDELEIQVSGRIYGYRATAYILPSLVTVAPPSEITPLQ